jgi:tRNA U34 5-methylaminomethyl-2-thiouridine-forming methyltransferase MnmC
VSAAYELVQLANGTHSIRSLADGETFHPVEGPIAEAQLLYVQQLRLRQRLVECDGEFVIWDVGLGAGGNALTTIHALSDLPRSLRIISFDRTLEVLRFAVQHATQLQFPLGFEKHIETLIEQGQVNFTHGALNVTWEVHLHDFPQWLAESVTAPRPVPAPHAIFFDAFSPARNPEMWTLPLFENLFRYLDPGRPCGLATFSRSSLARVTMLLAGLFVGAGEPLAKKEETTVAANALDLIDRPLDARWLQRVSISQSAEPLREAIYRQAPPSKDSLERLRRHRQFAPQRS